nr:immunoglobulin heavy chain junction region [Mus musculus]
CAREGGPYWYFDVW